MAAFTINGRQFSLPRPALFSGLWEGSRGDDMNQILGIYLLSMIVPAVALAVFVFLERRSRVPEDEVPAVPEGSVAQPKIKGTAQADTM
jgi:hypothetical protein